jgi:hypothetical protein
LDPRRSPGDNVDRLYIKARKAVRGRDEFARRIADAGIELAAMEESLARLRLGPVAELEWRPLEKRFGLPPPQIVKGPADTSARLPHRVYTVAPGVKVLVGKTSEDNDKLTRAAKADEYWIHTVAVPGSHVIVSRDRTAGGNKADLPPLLARVGAILAIHHSSLRTDHAGEVYITRRANVRKRKNAAPGLWDVIRSGRLFVRYTDEELKSVLDTLEAR